MVAERDRKRRERTEITGRGDRMRQGNGIVAERDRKR